MKRGAERQATRDDVDNDGDVCVLPRKRTMTDESLEQDNEPGQGLKKADEATLAGRK